MMTMPGWLHDHTDPLTGWRYLVVSADEPPAFVTADELRAAQAAARAHPSGVVDVLVVCPPDDPAPARLGWRIAARYLTIATSDLARVPPPLGLHLRAYRTTDAPAVAPVLLASVRESLRATDVPVDPPDLTQRVSAFLADPNVQGVLAERRGLAGYILLRRRGPTDLEIVDIDAVDRTELSALIKVLLAELARCFPGHRAEASVTGDSERADRIFAGRTAQGWVHTATAWRWRLPDRTVKHGAGIEAVGIEETEVQA